MLIEFCVYVWGWSDLRSAKERVNYWLESLSPVPTRANRIMIKRIEVTGATRYVISKPRMAPATIRNLSPEFRGVGNAADELGCVVAMTTIR